MPTKKSVSRMYHNRPSSLSKRNPVSEDQISTADARRSLFIDHYMIHLSVQEAARAVGISKRQGTNLMSKPEIKREIQERMDHRSSRMQIDAEYVLAIIRDTVERCRSLKPVRTKEGDPVLVSVDGYGEPMALCEFDAMAVLKGCELLGKHLKMFTDKFMLDIDDIEQMSDQQLTVLAHRIRRALMRNMAIDGDAQPVLPGPTVEIS